MTEKDELVQRAKLAEQAERWDILIHKWGEKLDLKKKQLYLSYKIELEIF